MYFIQKKFTMTFVSVTCACHIMQNGQKRDSNPIRKHSDFPCGLMGHSEIASYGALWSGSFALRLPYETHTTQFLMGHSDCVLWVLPIGFQLSECPIRIHFLWGTRNYIRYHKKFNFLWCLSAFRVPPRVLFFLVGHYDLRYEICVIQCTMYTYVFYSP